MSGICWIVAAASLIVVLACETATNPATGRREVLLMSSEEEQKVDEEQSREIEVRIGTAQDPELAAYIQSVGDRVAAYSPRQDVSYRFQVLEMDGPNALALPAGSIYITRGMLLLLNSEDELANVLAHEVAHVAARHAAQRHAHVSTFGLATLLGDLAGGRRVGEASSREAIGGPYGFVAFSRNQEREADRIGQEIVVQAGIDAGGMASMLRTLDLETRRQEGHARSESYFQTHPVTLERIADNATSAQLKHRDQTVHRGPEASRALLLAALDGMPITRPASEGVFQDGWFFHVGLGLAVRFPLDWEVQNRNDQVIGIAPDRNAVVLLELQGDGDDALAAARTWADREELPLLEIASVQIAGTRAIRARTVVKLDQQRHDAELTWIPFRGRIFRLSGARLSGRLHAHQGAARSFARSFRPITQAEIDGIRELRLRVATARQGETLGDLSVRTGNAWGLSHTAALNGLGLDGALRLGQQIKIAVPEPAFEGIGLEGHDQGETEGHPHSTQAE